MYNHYTTNGVNLTMTKFINNDFQINRNTNYLNNAAFGPVSNTVLDKYFSYIRHYSNDGPDSPFVKKEGYFEECRIAVSKLIKCDPDEVIFTQSITHGINIIAEGYKFIPGNNIVLREAAKEHVANFLPWLKIATSKRIELKITGSNEDGSLDLNLLEKALKDSNGGIIAVAHALYNLGTILKIEDITALAKSYNYRVLVDAAQTIGCYHVDVKKLGCDFMVFSGYKWLCAPPGIGVLYIKRDAQPQINYYGMDVRTLKSLTDGVQVKLMFTDHNYVIKEGPYKFENGFRNYSGVIGLLEAMKLVENIGVDVIYRRNRELIKLAFDRLLIIKGIKILGPDKLLDRVSILSFTIKGIQPSKLVSHLHTSRCVLAAREVGDLPVVRISPHYYNTKAQINECVDLINTFVK